MVQRVEATRSSTGAAIKLNDESFTSLEDIDEENQSKSSLVEENERLRLEIAQLKKQMSSMSRELNNVSKAVPARNTIKKADVVLELPATFRKPPMRLNCCARESPKELRSECTEDDQDTIEPNDYEAHASLSGLHHRSLHHPNYPPQIKQVTGSVASSTRTRQTEALSIDDETYPEECQGLIRRISEGKEPDDDDDDADEEDFFRIVSDRAGWLVGLLVLQSMSSFILARNEALLQKHLVIIRFLTMLVGAGGNAGNQASVRVIRGLAIGSIDESNARAFLTKEFSIGVALSIVLGVAGCIRAAVFMTPWLETLAITSSLFMIVIISIVLGALLPLGMKKVGIDPAHSSTTIQVFMDILGVSITVQVSRMVLDSGFSDWLRSAVIQA